MPRDFLPMGEQASFRSSQRDGDETLVGDVKNERASARIGVTSLVAVAIAVVAAVALTGGEKGTPTYTTASVPTEGTIIAVRFVAQATAADAASFFEAYKAQLIDPPRGGFYRIRISNSQVPSDELARLVARMQQEKVVEFVAVQQ